MYVGMYVGRYVGWYVGIYESMDAMRVWWFCKFKTREQLSRLRNPQSDMACYTICPPPPTVRLEVALALHDVLTDLVCLPYRWIDA